MIALYILAGVVFLALLVFIALMLRIRVSVTYKKDLDSDGDGSIYMALGPIRKQRYPEKKEKLKLSDFSAEKYRMLRENDSDRKYGPAKKEDAEDTDSISETLSLVGDLVNRFAGYLRCEVLRLRLTVGTSDAATTALVYPVVSHAVETVLDLIAQYTTMRLSSPKDVFVHADFENAAVCADISVKFSIRVLDLIKATVRAELNASKNAARRKALANNNHKNNSAQVRKNGDKS